MDKGQAIQSFWESFGLTAYDENTVPDDAQMPYITYSVVTDSLDYIVILNGSLWYRSYSWAEIQRKADQISAFLGIHGKVYKLDYGYLYLYRGTPFAQRMRDEDDTVRRIYFNVNGEFLTDI